MPCLAHALLEQSQNKETEMNPRFKFYFAGQNRKRSGTVNSHRGVIPSFGTCDMQLEETARGLLSQSQRHSFLNLQP